MTTALQRMAAAAAVLLTLAAGGTAVQADTVFVDAAGMCDGMTPCFTTIQNGVKHVTAPGTVQVFPGTYNESVDLSLMGMSVPTTPGDITLINASLPIEPLTTGPRVSPSTGSLTGPLAQVLQPIITKDEAGMNRALSRMHAAFAGVQTSAPITTFQQIVVRPATGPAFFNSVSPFPGDITITGFDVQSTDSDGIRLTAQGTMMDEAEIDLTLITANGNTKGNGLVLTADGEVDCGGCTANQNGTDGMVLNSTDNEIFVVNSIADTNTKRGMGLTAKEQVTVFGIPIVDPLVLFNDHTSASHNGTIGIDALSSNDDVTIGFPVFLNLQPPFFGVFATDNGGDGIHVQADGGSVISTTHADDNQGYGANIALNLANDETAVMLGSTASGNHLAGVTINAPIAFVLNSTVAHNTTNGVDFAVSDVEDFGPFGMFSAILIGVDADHNATGVVGKATKGPILLQGSLIQDNTADGIRLAALDPATGAQVNGNIICGNGVGLRLGVDQTIDATGNWWGDPSGPFHTVSNPSGLGNAVVDGGSGGGMGTANFKPVIDTVKVTFPVNPVPPGFPVGVNFQFSGGNGTVFLGSQSFFALLFGVPMPLLDPPFALTTDNGTLQTSTGTGTTEHETVNVAPGTVSVKLVAATPGTVTVTLTGPCGLAGTFAAAVRAVPSPALSAGGLVILAAFLSACGFVIAQRHARRG